MKMNAPPEQEASPQGTSPESGASPALTKKQNARRRILAATMGAPLIYTLPSGAQEAASSSHCEFREESTEPFAGQGQGQAGPKWGTVREEDGFVSDGTQWVSGSCWSSMQLSAVGSATKIV